MDVIEAIESRKSIRGFKPTPVPREVLRQVLETALNAPSAMNTQPWEITVVTGQALENIRRDNIQAFLSGAEVKTEIPHMPFRDAYRQRQVDLAIAIFRLMGITREDKEKRSQWSQRGLRFFDAPAAILLSLDRSLDSSAMSLLDIGALMQTICLAAMRHGLGTCIEDQGAMYPDVVRRHTGISASKRLAISIAIGYPDPDYPANRLESAREPLDKVVTWVE